MTLSYTLLQNEQYTLDDYAIISLRPGDIQEIRKWRNGQLSVLRQKKPISVKQQEEYFYNVILPSYSQQQPELILFSILKNDTLIGYGGLVHIDWQARRAEVSFLTSVERALDKDQYANDFSSFLTVLKTIAFTELSLLRLSTETFDIRSEVINILEHNGFIEEGRLKKHNYIDDEFVDSVLHGFVYDQAKFSQHRKISKQQKKSSEPANLLITSISAKIPLIKQIQATLHNHLPGSRLIGCDANPECLGQYFVDLFWCCPEDSVLSPETILAFCKKKSIRYIIPTRDEELMFYSSASAAFRSEGIHVMIPPQEAIRVCQDKLQFYNCLNTLDSVRVIPSSSYIEEHFGTRLVVKEQTGSGSKQIGLDLNIDKAMDFAKNLTKPIFQPYIEGKEYSIDIYLSRTAEVLGSVVRSRDKVVGGESQITTISENQSLIDNCQAIAMHLGLTGHVIFQAIIDDSGTAHIIECNCRIGGASTLSMAAGLHSIRWFIEECENSVQGSRKTSIPPTGMRMIRIPSDTFHAISDDEEKLL